MSYEDILQKMGLITIEERRRGDMIMLCNCATGRVKLDKDNFIIMNTRRMRGHKKLKIKRGSKVVKNLVEQSPKKVHQLKKKKTWTTPLSSRYDPFGTVGTSG